MKNVKNNNNKIIALIIASVVLIIGGYFIWKSADNNQTIILYKDTNNSCYFDEEGFSSTKVSRNIVIVEVPKKDLKTYYAKVDSENLCVFEDEALTRPVTSNDM
ncbi:MAG TPA: hypothetical protein PKB09_00225 [Candidatus Saccharibacteria bacterium]|nr:hypothetical protein [Candidatus Saccharibacteria bacterium]